MDKIIVKDLQKKRKFVELRAKVLEIARRSLTKMGFLEIQPPIIAPSTDPGLRGAQRLRTDFYGQKWYITSSMIMHKILAASVYGKVFALSPCVRAEPVRSVGTGRHLTEFWQIDVEMRGSMSQAMKVAEKLIADIATRFGKKVTLPLKRFSHRSIVKWAITHGFKLDPKIEVPWDVEKAFSETQKQPFFIIKYPHGSRGFYDKTCRTLLKAFDMIYPYGFGEAASGSEREIDVEMIIKKLHGEKLSEYQWFIDLVKCHQIKQTAGFGFGVERMIRWISGAESVKDVTLWPRTPGSKSHV